MLRRQLDGETSETAALSELLAIGLLAQGRGASGDEGRAAQAVAARLATPMARGASALALVLLDPGATSPAVAKDLVALLQSAYDREGVPWCRGQWDLIVASTGWRARRGDDLAVAVAGALRAEDPPAVWVAPAQAMLALAGFKKRWQPNDVAIVEELSDAQRAVGTSLARRSGVTNLGWGMPRSARDRSRWLGLVPPGPLEKRVSFELDGATRELPLWKVWRTLYELQITTEDLPAAIAERLDADERLEALLEVDIGAYGIRAQAGGAPMPLDVKRRTAEHAGPKAAQWARGHVDEILALVAAKAAPEIGDLGFKNALACFLAITRNGGTIEPRWNLYVPLGPVDAARAILEKLPPEQREEIVWLRINQPHLAAPNNPAIVQAVMPLVDLVPSQRIAAMVVARIRSANPPGAEQALAKLRELASQQPGIAQALA